MTAILLVAAAVDVRPEFFRLCHRHAAHRAMGIKRIFFRYVRLWLVLIYIHNINLKNYNLNHNNQTPIAYNQTVYLFGLLDIEIYLDIGNFR